MQLLNKQKMTTFFVMNFSPGLYRQSCLLSIVVTTKGPLWASKNPDHMMKLSIICKDSEDSMFLSENYLYESFMSV